MTAIECGLLDLDKEQYDQWLTRLNSTEKKWYQSNILNTQNVYSWLNVYAGWKILQKARELIGIGRSEEVQKSGKLDGYRADCSGTATYLLNSALNLEILHEGGGPLTSFYKSLEVELNPVPGQLISFRNHIGIWDPIEAKTINGIPKCDVLSMRGTGNKGSYDYGHNSWWEGDKYVKIPLKNAK